MYEGTTKNRTWDLSSDKVRTIPLDHCPQFCDDLGFSSLQEGGNQDCLCRPALEVCQDLDASCEQFFFVPLTVPPSILTRIDASPGLTSLWEH